MKLDDEMIFDAFLDGFSIMFFAVLQPILDTISPAVPWVIIASLLFAVLFRSVRSAFIGAVLGFALANLIGPLSNNSIF